MIDRKLVLLIGLLAIIALLYTSGVSLLLAGAIVTSAATIVLTLELLVKRGVIPEDAYYPALILGVGIDFIFIGLIQKGVIPLALAITGDPLIDAILVSTISAVIVTIIILLLRNYLAKKYGWSLSHERYASPFLE
ncbi:hypothetical protein [Infirmifilum sp.]|uniref:hypothetical protein n=1 Tax=Infirmifilum sp. TaxID=2856575 RepID=UPI003D0FBE27